MEQKVSTDAWAFFCNLQKQDNYTIQPQLKILPKITLSVICTHMVDFCRPDLKYYNG